MNGWTDSLQSIVKRIERLLANSQKLFFYAYILCTDLIDSERGRKKRYVFLPSDLLTQSALRYPGKEAVSYEDDRLTYAELKECTDKIASTLLQASLKQGDRVGIYAPKSVRTIAALLGYSRQVESMCLLILCRLHPESLPFVPIVRSLFYSPGHLVFQH